MSDTYLSFRRSTAIPALVLFLVCCYAASHVTGGAPVRYLQFEDVRETLNLYAGSDIPDSDITDLHKWDVRIPARDAEVRTRVDQGIEDSLSNLILYGTSFTNLPRLPSADDAASEDGDLTAAARARVRALKAALQSVPHNERLRYVREFLTRRGGPHSHVDVYLAGNLRRFVAEQRAYQKTLQDSAHLGDPAAVLFARGTLFASRGHLAVAKPGPGRHVAVHGREGCYTCDVPAHSDNRARIGFCR